MKQKFLSPLFIALLFISYASSQDLNTAIRQIKVGNSLREAQQFEYSQTYLLKGLEYAKRLNNQYWQAVAYEYLGILSKDMKEEDSAKQYLHHALNLYTSIRMDLSAKAVKDMLGSLEVSAEDIYAGIEIGSKGVKYSIIRVWRKNGQTSFVNMGKDSKDVGTISLTDAAIDETAKAVANYWTYLQRWSTPIPPERIFIAVSSGVKQELDKSPGKEEKLRNAFSREIPTVKDIGFLTPDMEVELTIRGTINLRDRLKSTSMDIGSGNTKGGYFKDRNNFDYVSVPWGSSTLSRKIANKPDKLASAETFFKDSVLNNNSTSLTEEIQRKTGFLNRQNCYLSGGIVWVICSYFYPEKVKETFVDFSKNDVSRFLQFVSTDSGFLNLKPDFSRITDEAILNAAKGEWDNTKQFSQIQLIAGGVILKGIMEQMGSGVTKKFQFIRSGEVGWISGYIATRVTEIYNKTHPD